MKKLAIVAVLLVAKVATAASPEVRCEASQSKATGKYLSCRLGAEAKALAKGESPDYSKCDLKLQSSWQASEDKATAALATCLDEPADANVMQAFLTNQTDVTSHALAGDCHLAADGCYKRVFVYTTLNWGAMGGYPGVDQKCQNAANGAGLGGTWVAWSSVFNTDAKVRIPDTQYRLVDGVTIVAYNKADLLDGTISHAISMDQNQNFANIQVWTGTHYDGLRDGSGYCGSWTDQLDGSSTVGSSNSTTDWSATAFVDCQTGAGLYCFEE